MLSALLFGLKWESSGKVSFANSFFKKRFIRIATSLYPFLMVLITLFVVFEIDFKVSDAILNFLFLGWFAKLPGNGHLWFLTVLMLCYVIFFFMSKIWNNRLNKWYVWGILGAITIACVFFVEHYGFPGHAFISLYLCAFGFANASNILKWVAAIPARIIYTLFVILGIIAIYAFLNYDINGWNRAVCVLINNLCGISILLFLLKIPYTKESKIIAFVSGISFELYLVHHGLCHGDLSVIHVFKDSLLANLILFLMISGFFSFLLNKISRVIKD